MHKFKKIKKIVKYLIEAVILYIFYYIIRLFTINQAARICRKLFTIIGNIIKENNVAAANLKLCFPELTDLQRKKILAETWQHFGSIIGEFAHWHDMSDREFNKRVKIINPDKMPQNKAIILSAHFGNWELFSRIFQKYKYKVNLVHRPMNNPYANQFINNLRANKYVGLIPKGKTGVRKMVEKINDKQIIGLLVDQKLNEGIKVPFFNEMAMTTPLPANLALKYATPLIPANITRTGEAQYSVEFFEPMKISKNDTTQNITHKINKIFESWIKQHPQQWFWFHNRWNKK